MNKSCILVAFKWQISCFYQSLNISTRELLHNSDTSKRYQELQMFNLYFQYTSVWKFMADVSQRGASKMTLVYMYLALISSQSLNHDSRWGPNQGTTDDFATIPFHLSLSSAVIKESPNPVPLLFFWWWHSKQIQFQVLTKGCYL